MKRLIWLCLPLWLAGGCAAPHHGAADTTTAVTDAPASAPTGVALLEQQQAAATASGGSAAGSKPAPAAPEGLQLIPNPLQNGPMLPPTASLNQWTQPSTATLLREAPRVSQLPVRLVPMARAGNTDASVALARAYAGGVNGMRDYSSAASWYRSAMADAAGQPLFYTAEGELGQMLLLGRSANDRRAEGLALVSDSASHHDAGGMAAYGLAYAGGLGVNTDYASAQSWLQNAQTAGNAPFADTMLGTMYLEGWGVPQDFQRAYSLFTTAAQAGDDDAWVKLGELYMYGIAVQKNYAEALTWFKKAEARDNPLAYFGLAELYSRGWGVKQNFTEAYVLYRIAASEGFPAAEGGAAFYNAVGLGIRRDRNLALEWAQKGTAAGDPVSEAWLKRLTKAK